MAPTEPARFDPRPIVAFFVLAYAFSWAWVIPWAATGHTVAQGQGWPTHLPSLLGPMLAAFVVTVFTTGRDGIRDLLVRMVRWRIGWRWWGIVLSPLAFFALVLVVMAAVGADLPPGKDFARFSGVSVSLGLVGVALVIALVNGFGEETGWRGFALPQLQRRFGPITASLIIAVLWAGWHIPQFFFLQSYQDFSIAMLPVFVFGLSCGAVLWAWIYNRTGSILAVATWHALYNITGGTKAATGGNGVISAAMWTFVVVAALAVLHADRRARRAGRASVLAVSPAAATPALAALSGSGIARRGGRVRRA